MNLHRLRDLGVRVLLAALALTVIATAAEAQSPTITYPADGATNANLTLPIQWTTVASAQAYYLYVGTTVGSKDVINSGEIQATSYLAPGSLPVNQLLFARIFAKVAGTWYFNDSTFTAAAPVVPTLTYPANGATNANLALPIQWTTVPNVQAYYLYVGTTLGAKNVINTGEIQPNSYLAPSTVPVNQLLYARIHAKVNNVWRYSDSTFTAATNTPVTATLTYPTNGATNVSLLQPMTWTTVANVQAYYLYVGTTVGTKNIINTGEIHTTQYQAPAGVPTGQTLYARIYAKVDGVWRYTDSTFSAAPAGPTLTFPANGVSNVNLAQPITWTTVANAQAYYLYVGTTLGAKDVVNTGEIQQTQYQAPQNTPLNQLLYARIFAKISGVWCYTDSTFTASSNGTVVLTSTLVTPANGATNVNLLLPMQWTSVPNVQAYYLYVGSAPGLKNIIDSGETLQTSYLAPGNVPVDQLLYVRLYTKVGGVWRYTDSTFTAVSQATALTYPPNGATDVDRTRLATWNSVPGAQAYYLYVGTAPGLKDIVDSLEMQGTSFPLTNVPTGQLLYARLWTKLAGYWQYRDTTFTALPLAPEFIFPHDGSTSVDTATPFQWSSSIGAQSYRLYVGTFPGSNDLADSGEINALTHQVAGLPATGVLYGRVWAKVNGVWARHSDIAFTRDGIGAGSTIVVPVNGSTTFDTMQPFEWEETPLARAYWLRVGTAPACNELHDSGEIHVTERFVPSLPAGVPLCGKIGTKIDGQWQDQSFNFTVIGNHVSSTQKTKAALWATDFVRAMAGADNRPFDWGSLRQDVGPRYAAASGDFSTALLRTLGEVNVGASAGTLLVSFNATVADSHTLVEQFDSATGRWLLLDAMFDVTVKRLDGSVANAEDVSQATNTLNWNGVQYVFLGPDEDDFAQSYHIDYPLLFANVYHVGDTFVVGQGNSVLPFLQSVALPASGPADVYVVKCLSATATSVVINGTETPVACDGVGGTSAVFSATSVTAPAGAPAFDLYRVQRFVF